MNSENEYTWNGVRFVAVEKDSCKGCAFESDHDACGSAPFCAREIRHDGRSVIWVRADQQIKARPALVPLTDELKQDIASIRKAERWMHSTSLPVPTDVYESLALAIAQIERACGIAAPQEAPNG